MTVLGRRTVLQGMGALAAGALMPRLSFARGGGGSRRFVLVILRGALDGLGAVPAPGDPDYAALRGALAVDANDAGLFDLGRGFALAPALAPLGAWWREGALIVRHAVATPYRDRSHFAGQDVLESGQGDPHAVRDGWMNRLIALLDPPGPHVAVSIGPTVPLVLRGDNEAASWMPGQDRSPSGDYLDRIRMLYRADPHLYDRFEAGLDVTAFASAYDTPATGDRVAHVAEAAGRLLAADAGPRIAVLDLPGWDTHFAQAGRLAEALGVLAATLAALRSGLGTAWADTAIVCATEFGRTARPNGSGGTDHGTASVALLAGGTVDGGRMVGDWPGLGRLWQDRDLAPTGDLRALLKGVLIGHMGLDPDALERVVFPGSADAAPVPELMRAGA